MMCSFSLFTRLLIGMASIENVLYDVDFFYNEEMTSGNEQNKALRLDIPSHLETSKGNMSITMLSNEVREVPSWANV